ncbi:Transglutaminase-like superfamily protein [Pseudoxanthomonas sp. GM95]|uniref:DUF3857 domain-containing protein n=1 Tax=Pseudoxanthomonas sp. GM95 TaxID=1881043 RepID=UPI0008B3250C|nr:DUF3857 domain-containing protein [Pseudoxanthomonas sp. GM95]SEK99905.1 Transglutaminase-like superfamily protein [Pseudoxanthomonas sp. GM95]
MLWKSGVAGVLLWLCAAAPGKALDRPAMAASPAWVVNEADAPSEGKPAERDDLRYEVVSDQIDLTGAKPVWHRHIRYLVARERGLSDAGSISIGYQPDYQSLVLNQLEVVRDGQRIDLRERAHYARLRREQDLDNGLLDGELTLSITVPDLRVGDRLDYSFSVVGDNPIFGNAYYETYAARYGVPLAFRRVLVRYPATHPLRSQVTAPGFDMARSLAGNVATLDITAHDLPAVREPDETPEGHDSFGRISVSTVQDWESVVDWAVPLYPRAFSDRDVADNIARQLKLDPAQPESSLLRAAAFVQGQIRYTGLDMGDNSHKPHAPEETLRNRYGDCKDKATLLIALLALADVRAEPVLVNTRPGYDLGVALPGANVFDHVVVRAHLPSGEVWVDGTRDREDGPLAERRALPFRSGLPLVSGATALVEVPYPVPSRPQVDVDERVDLTERGDGYATTFKVATTYRQGQGDNIVEAFANDGAQEQGRRYLRYMRDFYDGLQAKGDPRLDEADGPTPSIHETYALNWDKADGSALDLWLFQLNDWMKEIPDEPRTTPLALQGPRLARQRITLHIDTRINVPDLRQEVSNPWFRFVRTEHVEGQTMIITGEWARLATQVPASGIARAARDMDKARDLLVFTLDLDPQTGLAASTWKDWRWPVVAVCVTALLVLASFLLRRRRSLIGMLFRPRATTAALPQRRWLRVSGWATFLLVTFVFALADGLEPGLQGRALWAQWGIAMVATFFAWVRLAIGVSILKLALRWLKRPVDFGVLFTAVAAAGFPLLVFTLGVLLAVQGHLGWLHDAFEAKGIEAPGVLTAGVLLAIGGIWACVSSVCAVAAVAGSSRRRALAAVAICMGFMLVLVGALFGASKLLGYAAIAARGAAS